MFKLLKSKKGSFLTTLIIFPLWLFLIIMMGYEVNNHKSIEELSNTNQTISRIIETSYNYEEANKKINGYFSQKKDKDMYKVNNENGTNSYIEITKIERLVSNGDEVEFQNIIGGDLKNLYTLSKEGVLDNVYFVNKNIITYKITIYTSTYKNNIFKISVGSYSWNM